MSSPYGPVKRRSGIREHYERDTYSPAQTSKNYSRNTTREFEESRHESFKSVLSHNYDSDESIEDSYERSKNSSFERSRSIPRSPKPNTINTPKAQKARVVPPNDSLDRAKKCTGGNPFGFAGTCLKFIGLLAMILCVCLMVNGVFLKANDMKKECDFGNLKDLYPGQDERLWQSLQNGIENILKQLTHAPGVYLLLHHEKSQQTKNLIKDIGRRSNECFGNKSAIIELKPEDFRAQNALQDYGLIVEKYRQQLEKGHVALIANLNEIPPESARALHSICDTVSPLVKDVVIYLTLEVPREMGTSPKVAYSVLLDLWGSKLQDNEIDALITRVADYPLFLQGN